MRLLLLLLLLPFVGATQLTYYIRSDSVKIMKQGGNNELILQNGSRAVKGVLVNVGNGLTRFIASRTSGDTLFVGLDTLIGAGSQNLQQVTDIGPNTTDTISAKGVRTPYIGADTTAEAPFTIMIVPDLQKMGAAYNTFHPQLRSIFDYAVNNKVSENIVAFLQVGDITDFSLPAEYDTIDHQFDRLDSINAIPYLAIPGNHDYDNLAARTLTDYPTYFGIPRYAAKPWYVTSYDADNANFAIKFDAGTKKYFVIGLEMVPRDAVLTWANNLADSLEAADPEREIMVVTHIYLTNQGWRANNSTYGSTTYYGMTGNAGQEMWDSFVKLHRNIRYVFSGHFVNAENDPASPVGGRAARLSTAGVNGNMVHQFMIDYQFDAGGGNGYFMKLKIDPSTNNADVSFYSDYLAQTDIARRQNYTIDAIPLQVENSIALKELAAYGDVHIGDSLFINTPGLDSLRLLATKVNNAVVGVEDLFTLGVGSTGTAPNWSSATAKYRTTTTLNIPVLNGTGADTTNTASLINNAFKLIYGPTTFYPGPSNSTPIGRVSILSDPRMSSNNLLFVQGYQQVTGQPMITFQSSYAPPGVFSHQILRIRSTAMNTGDAAYFEIGRATSNFNRAYLGYYYAGLSSTDNNIFLGHDAVAGLNVYGTGNVSIGSLPAVVSPSYKFFVNGTMGAVLPAASLSADSANVVTYNSGTNQFTYYPRTVSAGGTFTPTGTAGSNVDAVTPFALHYTRSGPTVTFSGTVEIDATAAGGAIVELSLPFASAFTSTTDAAGTASTVNGAVYGSVANDRLVILITAAGGAPTQYQFTGSYTIK